MKEIKLSTGETIKMREPKVRDMMMVKDVQNDIDREIELLANITEKTEEELYDLSLSDYSQLQEAFKGFQLSKSKK